MATYTSNYGWTKPSGSDNVDISVLNGNLDDQDSTIHDAFLNMAPPFSESSTYAVDDIVLYGTGLYKCHTAVVTPGSWTGSTNWQVYKLSEGGSGGGGTSNYNQLTNKPQINNVELSGNKTTSDLGISYTDLTNKPSLATVATSGSYADLTSKPQVNGVELSGNKTASQLGMNNSNTFQGTIAEWNQLTTAEKKAYDHASIPDSLDGNVTFPASKVMMQNGDSVEERIEDKATVTLSATGSTLEATVKNGILFIYFNITPSTANTWVYPFSDALPAGYRPNRSIYVSAITTADLKVANVFINNDGTIQIKGASTGTFTGCASYYI